jgi:hypothetical protein
MSNPGIDYGLGQTNIDTATGIRYGVIHAGDVCQAWSDCSEADYGDPHCPKCGNEAQSPDDQPDTNYVDRDDYEHLPGSCGDYCCDQCQIMFDGDRAFGDEPNAWYIDDGEYKATQDGDDCDIFVLSSPYFTRAEFCSPCAPGAAYLRSPCPDGPRAYCFGPGWFDDESPCPYPVYRVDTGELIYSPPSDNDA